MTIYADKLWGIISVRGTTQMNSLPEKSWLKGGTYTQTPLPATTTARNTALVFLTTSLARA